MIVALIGANAYADEKASTVPSPLRLNTEGARGVQVCDANTQQLQQRLQTLRAELKTGEAEIKALQQKEAQVRQTMLRIHDAIKILEEELAKAGG
jgi:peptidoglycan hydrolase CwlO-like protein